MDYTTTSGVNDYVVPNHSIGPHESNVNNDVCASDNIATPGFAYRGNTTANLGAGSGIYANDVLDGSSSFGGPSGTYNQGNYAFGSLEISTCVSSVCHCGGSSQAFPGMNDFAIRDASLGPNSDYTDHGLYSLDNSGAITTHAHNNHAFHEPSFEPPAVNPARWLDETSSLNAGSQTNPGTRDTEPFGSAFSYTSAPKQCLHPSCTRRSQRFPSNLSAMQPQLHPCLGPCQSRQEAWYE